MSIATVPSERLMNVLSQLDCLSNKTVKGTCSIVPNVKQKPKIKFREFLTH